MGMLFGGLDEEELNTPPADNFVYKQLKRARYKGIELCEGDRICVEINGNQYIIRDFKENGCPIVDLITNNAKKAVSNQEWYHDTLLVIKSTFG